MSEFGFWGFRAPGWFGRHPQSRRDSGGDGQREWRRQTSGAARERDACHPGLVWPWAVRRRRRTLSPHAGGLGRQSQHCGGSCDQPRTGLGRKGCRRHRSKRQAGRTYLRSGHRRLRRGTGRRHPQAHSDGGSCQRRTSEIHAIVEACARRRMRRDRHHLGHRRQPCAWLRGGPGGRQRWHGLSVGDIGMDGRRASLGEAREDRSISADI